MTKLREKLLGLGGKEKVVEIGGEKYLLVATTEKKASQIQQAALKYSLKKDGSGNPLRDDKGKLTNEMDFKMDQLELKVRALIECAYDPETRTPIFSQNDPAEVEALYASRPSADRRKLMEACVELIAPDIDEVEKNSSATPGDASSSA
jgi:hypothetical protein